MFAHQVIEDLTVLFDGLSKHEMGSQEKWAGGVIHLMMKHIGEAQKFHLGNATGILSIAKKHHEKPLFMGEFGDVKLPYDKVWFDYPYGGTDWYLRDGEASVPKRGILAISGPEGTVWVWIVNYSKNKKMWLPSPTFYVISIGKLFREIDGAMSMFSQMTNGRAVAVGDRNVIPIFWSVIHEDLTKDIEQQLINDDLTDLTILNCVLLLLGCKNIRKEAHPPPEKLNKARMKRKKQPLFTYHTLVLKPCNAKQESIPKHLWENRIHLCRGHFKTYTEEKPLFGHITGRFWWQPSVRGRNREGVVMKDYVVDKSMGEVVNA